MSIKNYDALSDYEKEAIKLFKLKVFSVVAQAMGRAGKSPLDIDIELGWVRGSAHGRISALMTDNMEVPLSTVALILRACGFNAEITLSSISSVMTGQIGSRGVS